MRFWYVIRKMTRQQHMFNLNKEIMKKLLLAVCLTFGGATLVTAQDDRTSTSTQTQTQAQSHDQDQDKQQISVSELPDAVTAKLESQDYSGWTVGSAYKKMGESNQEMYIVELRQGAETKKIKFDRDGNQIEKDKQHHDKADNANYRNKSDAADQSMDSEQLESSESDVQSDVHSPESRESATESADEQSDIESAEQSTETQSTEQSTEQADNATEQEQK